MTTNIKPDPVVGKAAILNGEASLAEIRDVARDCRACRLWTRGTQTVFGESALAAPRLMLVGEQPGDKEDLAGHPFVGPAGRVLDEALDQAGIDRRTAYLTNIVKHFSWEARGKRRIHKKPKADEIRACRPWLEAEIAAVAPELIVCLGATAAQGLLGPKFRVTQSRGQVMGEPGAPRILATVHPSSILRITDSTEMARFVEDLSIAAAFLQQSRAGKRAKVRKAR
jgi:uracil-DNA glycosylase family protein